jgi:hypothetical protein
VRIWWCYK